MTRKNAFIFLGDWALLISIYLLDLDIFWDLFPSYRYGDLHFYLFACLPVLISLGITLLFYRNTTLKETLVGHIAYFASIIIVIASIISSIDFVFV